MPTPLPTVEMTRVTAFRLIADGEDGFRSERQPATQPSAQLTVFRQARAHLAQAEAAVNRAVS